MLAVIKIDIKKKERLIISLLPGGSRMIAY